MDPLLQGLKWNTDGWLQPDPQHQQYGDDYPTFFEAQVSTVTSKTAVNPLSRTGVGAQSKTGFNGQIIRITRKPGSVARGHVEGRVRSAGLWGGERNSESGNAIESSDQNAASFVSNTVQNVETLAATAGGKSGTEGNWAGEGQIPTWLGNEGGWAPKKVEAGESENGDQTAAVGEDGELETELADEARKVSSAGLFEFLWKPRKDDESALKERLSSGRERSVTRNRARNPWDDGDDRPRKLLLPRGGLAGVGGQLLRGDWRSARKEGEGTKTAGSAEKRHDVGAQKREEQKETEKGDHVKVQKRSNGGKRSEEKASDGEKRPWYQWQWRAKELEADDRLQETRKGAEVQENKSASKEQPEKIPAAAQLSKFWLKGPAHEKPEEHVEQLHYASVE